MRISDIERFIRARKNSQIHLTTHTEVKCKERSINSEQIREMLLKKEILGIVKQQENCYKLWLRYAEDTDLNVIARIELEELHIITVFPCDAKRRRK